ncbi:hypothetical protein GKG47_11965 [Lactonifactor sp. BIOML-A3]|uniref:hypothetical protein n=1 Tax=unclassified Lactonifactor TaxID=2636670 RepID=UPI0012B14892|nr:MULTISPECIES: hypothetical protein [unclassified Lactonifactor]MSA01024.1 hypothetical protein [Lactonifactor sp. BIOML-A5]MSA10330.1 hypothetical protein [Lactonifactor sp. BIOML-A4]MSA13140.1 hypothetical protein [Lactonifactor sp. BIOML-A3]MSA19302.1 hypothetical protein [Lactonifactor sp. BIOML-A2]MSA38379.1 hypothetical protein [Lactonifactor sp. BIOML-A1]
MADLKILQAETQANVPFSLEFDVLGLEYFVMNCTDDYVYASLKKNAPLDECLPIPPGCGIVLTVNKRREPENCSKTVYIIPEGTSERKVVAQCILWQ